MEDGRERADGGVQQGSVEPTNSGASPQKRGETPRQQIRRGKKATRGALADRRELAGAHSAT